MKIVTFLFSMLMVCMCMSVKAEEDTTLYVKTEYAHEIYSGRNTARKYALKQEMRNTHGVLFREVFYNDKTRQVDYTLYYFYNNDKSIRLIERVNIDEVLIGYSLYTYKKGKLVSIGNFDYDSNSKKSNLVSTQVFAYKKSDIIETTYNNSKKVILSTTKTLRNNKIVKEIINYNLNDSIKTRQFERIYRDTLLELEKELVITRDNDTNVYTSKYLYNENNAVDSIISSSNRGETKYTLFKYFPNGALQNKRIIGKNDYYYANTTYDLRKYYRKELPKKEPQF